jgi:predicted aspartyl protease
MKSSYFILPLILLTSCTTDSRQGEAKALFDAPPRIESQEQEIDLALVLGTGGRRYVSCSIHGKTFLFLVDTGAVTTIVSAAVARDLGIATIPVARGTLYGGGGASSATVGLIDKMNAGGLVVSRLPVMFTDLSDWNTRERAAQHKSIDGIIGSDLLEYLRASIDYTTNTMRLRKPEAAITTPRP